VVVAAAVVAAACKRRCVSSPRKSRGVAPAHFDTGITGAVVKDGDTIGLSEQQKIKVRHSRVFRPDVNAPVYWIELTEQPTVRKPKGFFSSFQARPARQ